MRPKKTSRLRGLPAPIRKDETATRGGSTRRGYDEDCTPVNNHYTTVGFYDLDDPEGDGPAIPAFKDRLPVPIPLPPGQAK